MAKIVFELADGSQQTVESNAGETVMEAAVRNAIPGILAECGGACACATCHVILSSDVFSTLGDVDDMEASMLEFAEGAESTSRLACQISVSEALDGIVVRVPG